MPRTALLPALLVVATAALVAAPDSSSAPDTGVPSLEIVSRLGAAPKVKVWNDEEVVFMARRRDAARPELLRNVRFALHRADGAGEPIHETEDEARWGRPPSSFALPLEKRLLPPGRYLLRALHPSFRPAETEIVVARLEYHDLEAKHDENAYRASFGLRLVDSTERRRAVPLEVRVESLGGALVDARQVFLVPVPRDATFEGRGPVRLSSRIDTPDRERPERDRTGVLKVRPGCRLVLVLDGIRFPWSVPLPAEAVRGPVLDLPGEGSGRSDGRLR